MGVDTVANTRCISLRALVACIQIVAAVGLDVGRSLDRRAAASSTYYVSDVANRFGTALQQLKSRDAHRVLRDVEEVAKTKSMIEQATIVSEKALLEEAFEIQQESRIEEANAEGTAASFVAMLQQIMGNEGGAHSCRELACGGNGYCDAVGTEGAICKCKAGYDGNGFVCNPATTFLERPLIAAAPGTAAPQVADLHVSTLRGNAVAVAFRDVSRQNRGFVVVGEAHDGGMRWGAPTLISEKSSVFGPVLVELMDSPGGLALAYRTQNRGGEGVLRYGRRDSENRVTFGTPQTFAHYQAQKMVLIPLPQSRIALLFSEHVPLKAGARQFDMFGASLLAELSSSSTTDSAAAAVPRLLGKYRFATGAVSRLSAAPLSPTRFAVAYRQAKAEGSQQSREATVSLAELWGSELVFTTKTLSLEPGRDQIWARSVAGLENNAFTYTYHSGEEQLTKQAVLRLDPDSHRLVLQREPEIVSSGFTPFVSTVSTIQQQTEQQTSEQLQLLQSHGHRLFTFLGTQQGARGQGRICGVGADGLPFGCKDLGTTAREVLAVASAPVGDGRVFLLTADAKGAPYYALVGLMPNH